MLSRFNYKFSGESISKQPVSNATYLTFVLFSMKQENKCLSYVYHVF